VPWSRKSRAIPLTPPTGRTAGTEPQCLYKGAIYFNFYYSRTITLINKNFREHLFTMKRKFHFLTLL